MSANTANAPKGTRAFDGWTDPAQVAHWMEPGEVKCVDVQVDLKAGGAYRIHMRSDESDHVAVREYQEVTPNERLQFT